MKIALLITGQKRDFDLVKHTIEEHLIDNLERENHTVDVFINCDEDISIKNLKGIIIDKFCYSTPTHHPQMIRFCHTYHSFVKDKDYNFIIRIRPDFYIHSLLPTNQWDTDRINSRVVLFLHPLPKWFTPNMFGIGNPTVDDQFFIVSGKIADKVFSFNRGNEVVDDKEFPDDKSFPEVKLTKLWKSHGLFFNVVKIHGSLYKSMGDY